jgi:hypothetical protein
MTLKKPKTAGKCVFCKKPFLRIKGAKHCSDNCKSKDFQNSVKDLRKVFGLKISNHESKIIFDGETDLSKNIRIKIPYNTALSKNALFGFGNRRVYMKETGKKIKEEIFYLIKSEVNKQNIVFVPDKIWVGILVQKPSMNGIDPINVIDLICDAIKEAIGVDDKWFSIRLLDWQIKKENPQIIIEIGQSSDNIPKKTCRYCGRIVPLDNMVKNKTSKDGYSTQCKDCDKSKYGKLNYKYFN